MAEEKALADLVVGDRFWLSYAQELVKAAVSAPDRRAEQLTIGIAWFWTIYSAAVLVLFTTRNLPLAISIPLGLPVILLIAAYWLALRVRAPIRVEFDPRVPGEIEAVHHQTAEQRNRLLFWAEGVTGLAAACVVVAVALALFTQVPDKPDFYGYAGRQASDNLVLGGAFPKQSVLRVHIQPLGSNSTPAKDMSLVYRASESGELHAQLNPPPADSYRVTVDWKEEKAEKTITIEVKRGE